MTIHDMNRGIKRIIRIMIERAMRIELTSLAWEARVIAIIRRPHETLNLQIRFIFVSIIFIFFKP